MKIKQMKTIKLMLDVTIKLKNQLPLASIFLILHLGSLLASQKSKSEVSS